MKKIFILKLYFFCTIVYSQISSLPSVNAMSQTKFSDVSVNESSGKLTQNLPLYSYNSGGLNIPINLFYSGNGVKVIQQSSWVGTNWSLNAGGVVTRIVNDIPDEKATHRVFFEEIQSYGTNLEGHLYVKDSSDTRDFRADLFSYSFPGYSGSFYLDQNFVPRLTDNNSELKIEFVGGINNSNNNIILITTPFGDKYYFGGINASERTSSLVAIKKKGPTDYLDVQTLTEINTIVNPDATTAFYLFKAENLFGDQILFDYNDHGTKNYVLYEQQKLPEIYGPIPTNEACVDLTDYANLKSSIFKVSIHNIKTINRIYSPNSNYEVRFNSSDLLLPPYGTVPTPQYDGRILNSIQVYDNILNENVKNIKFEYLMPQGANSKRFFLEKLSFNNSNSLNDPKCESYKFEYDSPGDLPDRFSYEVDLLGYFNGNANTTLIAENQNITFDSSFQNLAVRETNFEFANKGTLKKMYTPTGGFNEFEYENPQVATITNLSKDLRIYRNQTSYVQNNQLSQSFNIGGELPEPGQPVLTNPVSQTMSVVVTAEIQPNGAYHHHKIIVEVKDLITNQIVTDYVNFFTGTLTYQKVLTFSLVKDHNYRVTLKFDPATPTSQDASVEATAVCYYKGNKYFSALGLRLKSIKIFDENNLIKDYKRYFYKKYQDLNTSNDDSAIVTYEPGQSITEEGYCCTGNDLNSSLQVVSLVADPMSYYFSGSDNQVEYKFVTVSFGGDYFEGGGVEKEFKVEKSNKTKQYLYGPFIVENPRINFGSNNLDNSNMFNGLLLGEKILKKENNNSLFVTSEKKYNYSLTVDHEIKNISVVKQSSFGCILPTNTFFGYPPIGHYSNFSYSNKLMSVEAKEFLSPTLANNVSTTTTTYEYGTTLKGLPIKVQTLDSKGNTQIVEYKYVLPTEVYSETFPTANLNAFSFMNSNNVKAIPVEVINKYKIGTNPDKIIDRTATLYKLHNGAFVVDKVVKAKANGLYKSEVEYSLYDSDFNLLEVTFGGQIKKSFIYGYDNKILIAELNNTSYSSIPSGTITNLKSLSDNVVDETSMNQFQTALIALRSSLPNSFISSSVYDKYKQLRISTDARNYSIYNTYDECKRLKFVKDTNGNILEEFKYNLLNN